MSIIATDNFCLLQMQPPHLFNVFRANQVTTQIHHIGNRHIRQNVHHPQRVVQRCDVVRVIVGVREERIWELELVREQKAQNWDVLNLANFVCTILRVDLLPIPPKAVQIRVVEEKQWIRGAGALWHEALATWTTLGSLRFDLSKCG